MYSVNNWYFFTDEMDRLLPKTCNKIINLSKNKWKKPSVDVKKGPLTDEERITGVIKPIYDINKNSRISDIVWTSDQWIYDTIWPYMQKANERAGWKYDIIGAESMQITRYKKGGFYQFHKDGKGDHFSVYKNRANPLVHNRVRKL